MDGGGGTEEVGSTDNTAAAEADGEDDTTGMRTEDGSGSAGAEGSKDKSGVVVGVFILGEGYRSVEEKI